MTGFTEVCFKLDKKIEELQKQQEKAIKAVIDQGGYFEVGSQARDSIILEVLTILREIFEDV